MICVDNFAPMLEVCWILLWHVASSKVPKPKAKWPNLTQFVSSRSVWRWRYRYLITTKNCHWFIHFAALPLISTVSYRSIVCLSLRRNQVFHSSSNLIEFNKSHFYFLRHCSMRGWVSGFMDGVLFAFEINTNRSWFEMLFVLQTPDWACENSLWGSGMPWRWALFNSKCGQSPAEATFQNFN